MTAQTLTTTLTLHELKDALASQPPVAEGRRAGWRGSANEGSNLNIQNGVPPLHAPTILAADDFYPERLAARFYYWEQRKLNDGVARGWFLDGVDVLISEIDGSYLVLWSSHDATLIGTRKGDASASLESLASGEDAPRAQLHDDSPLRIAEDDIYLWLTRKADRRQALSDGVFVNSVEALTTGENAGGRAQTSRRSGTLAGSVDLSRISFLTAVATESTLGPAAVSLAIPNDDDTFDQIAARVWRNSQYRILTGSSHFRGRILEADEKRLEIVQALAYRFIPLIISERDDDDDWSATQRDRLVLEKQIELARIFRALALDNPLWDAYAEEQNGDVFAEMPTAELEAPPLVD
ncbi:hypothetical protein [Rathayibacter sp. AY1D1]|uniref:hypothetical protein n=1 Tax=Rathayibacter sp. AY1D1 TaxID=2080542 RepID=UPI0011B02CA1|nr:hypothetical protein [Rathayibacter sp. AY1D1]